MRHFKTGMILIRSRMTHQQEGISNDNTLTGRISKDDTLTAMISN